jgi:hypothetical protein
MSRGMVIGDLLPGGEEVQVGPTRRRALDTLAIATVPGRKGIWLVAISPNQQIEPLAKFRNQACADRFVAALDLGRMAAHAAGRSGI